MEILRNLWTKRCGYFGLDRRFLFATGGKCFGIRALTRFVSFFFLCQRYDNWRSSGPCERSTCPRLPWISLHQPEPPLPFRMGVESWSPPVPSKKGSQQNWTKFGRKFCNNRLNFLETQGEIPSVTSSIEVKRGLIIKHDRHTQDQYHWAIGWALWGIQNGL